MRQIFYNSLNLEKNSHNQDFIKIYIIKSILNSEWNEDAIVSRMMCVCFDCTYEYNIISASKSASTNLHSFYVLQFSDNLKTNKFKI